MKRKMLVVIMVSMVFLNFAFAEKYPINANYKKKVVMDSYLLIHKYWDVLEVKYKFEELAFPNKAKIGDLEKEYIIKARDLKNFADEFAKRLIASMTSKNRKEFIDFSKFYKTMKFYNKWALDIVVKQLLEKHIFDMINQNPKIDKEKEEEAFLKEYFPGYGYTDPSYIYRKGKEVERKLLQAFWKTEKETVQSTNYMEMTITAELLAKLEAQVEFLKIIKLFNIEINGKVVAAAKVSFQVKKTLETECKVKYEKNKVWFELWRAKKTYWSTPQWELCGKTYEFFEEPTGEQVVVDSKIKPASISLLRKPLKPAE